MKSPKLDRAPHLKTGTEARSPGKRHQACFSGKTRYPFSGWTGRCLSVLSW